MKYKLNTFAWNMTLRNHMANGKFTVPPPPPWWVRVIWHIKEVIPIACLFFCWYLIMWAENQ